MILEHDGQHWMTETLLSCGQMLVDDRSEIVVGENPADGTLDVEIADVQLASAGQGHGANAIGLPIEREGEGDGAGSNSKVRVLHRAAGRVSQREQVVEEGLAETDRAARQLGGTRRVDLLNGAIEGSIDLLLGQPVQSGTNEEGPGSQEQNEQDSKCAETAEKPASAMMPTACRSDDGTTAGQLLRRSNRSRFAARDREGGFRAGWSGQSGAADGTKLRCWGDGSGTMRALHGVHLVSLFGVTAHRVASSAGHHSSRIEHIILGLYRRGLGGGTPLLLVRVGRCRSTAQKVQA
ncbi:hypothetical protein KTAU_19350 [Thermogemmatispora aurantia]|uniref:Uncharacterized protein n=1 Tax=Thermogemmatispora aurantia TaxID=2045279 RepID=A0A5J4K3F5_9CHLR|nr:hypothetical protein KTAU_19350 [Thermogemmatispora aurantia]